MHNRTVLIVDDDKGILEGVGWRLRSEGFQVVTAADGGEGIEAAIEHQPDAVLLDVRMPNVDGLTALEVLREDSRTRHIPIVILSASLRDQQTALEAGAQFFLTKPYRSRDLLAALDSVLQEESRTEGSG